jgi:hypothetical protein
VAAKGFFALLRSLQAGTTRAPVSLNQVPQISQLAASVTDLAAIAKARQATRRTVGGVYRIAALKEFGN